MKNRCKANDVWKDEMIRRWENLVLMYQRIREHPTSKLVGKLLLELLKIFLRIFARKLIEFFLDET